MGSRARDCVKMLMRSGRWRPFQLEYASIYYRLSSVMRSCMLKLKLEASSLD